MVARLLFLHVSFHLLVPLHLSVAGAGSMNYKFFLTYNIIGAFCWVASFVTLGYLFGGHPLVKDNFTHLIFGIIIISILPGVIGFIRQKLKPKS